MTAVSDFQKYCVGVLLVLMYSNAAAYTSAECFADAEICNWLTINGYSDNDFSTSLRPNCKNHQVSAKRNSHPKLVKEKMYFSFIKSVPGFLYHQNKQTVQKERQIINYYRSYIINGIQQNRPKNKDDLEDEFLQ